jgi:Zn-finger domain-containing protein
MPVNSDKAVNEKSNDASGIFGVVVTMEITDVTGKEVDSKKIDFGKLKRDQVKGLADLFSMMSSNIEYIKKLEPQYERLDKNKPPYLR